MINKKQLTFLVLLVTLLMLLIYGIWIEPYQVDVHHLQIKGAGINKVLKDKIAVHLSDLHIIKIGKREKKILKILDDLKPDLIFLTGDYVGWGGDYEPALTFLSSLKAKIGVWAVMGDYDYSSSRKSCLFCHEQGSGKFTERHKVRFLRNEMELDSLPDGYAWLGGSDPGAEFNYITNGGIRFLEEKTPSIILSHSPLIFDLVFDQDVLILAGDTHGGQIPFPSWLWGILGYEKSALYNQGLFQKGQKKMYVSRGIGTSHLPIRFLRPPELVVLHF
ncbi:MAG: metallophosphoesterase [Deltaproteobacteria bacterium]|nr:metallophosphoesterase [Deltaproteobacteria bacterium]